MAMADYYLCDVCGGKAIYDADIDERWDGHEMAILCKACSLTHEVKVVPRDPARPHSDEGRE